MSTSTGNLTGTRAGGAPAHERPGEAPRRGRRERAGAWLSLRRHPWVVLGVALVIFSYFLLRWARTSPGYDPYGWLVWGYQTLRGTLNLGGAPSWKPVTFLFTVPYSLFGHYSWWLWTVTAVSVALVGPIVAGRIVYRLVLHSSGERWPALIGAVFAGLCLLGIVQYTHYWLSAQSDPMLVTFFLLAIDMHMLGRHRWAFTFLWLCSLGRPETWPFIGLYFLWAWRAVPRMRLLMVVELILIPAFWFGIPALTGSNWDVAGQLAQNSPRELHSNKVIGTLTRFRELSYSPVEAVAGLGVIIAALRRDWRVLIIAGCSAVWMAIEIAFALHGFPGVPRYMFEAAGLMIVVAGVCIGWLLTEPARLMQARLASEGGSVSGARGHGSVSGAGGDRAASDESGDRAVSDESGDRAVSGAGSDRAAPDAEGDGAATDAGAPEPSPNPSRSWLPGAARVAGVVAVVAVVALMVPRAVHAARTEHADLVHERARTAEIQRLDATLKALGGYRFVRSCGDPAADVEWVSILAWYTKLDVGYVGHRPEFIVRSETTPSVLFTALGNGWIVHTYHLPPTASSACRRLNDAYYIVTPQHPGGVLGHQT